MKETHRSLFLPRSLLFRAERKVLRDSGKDVEQLQIQSMSEENKPSEPFSSAFDTSQWRSRTISSYLPSQNLETDTCGIGNYGIFRVTRKTYRLYIYFITSLYLWEKTLLNNLVIATVLNSTKFTIMKIWSAERGLFHAQWLVAFQYKSSLS